MGDAADDLDRRAERDDQRAFEAALAVRGPAAAGPITGPGIYTIPAEAYHADPCPEPSLSSSIARMLCFNSAAHAQHDHPRLNPLAVDEDAEHFDIGTAAHALLLEGQQNIAVVDAKDWRTNVAKAARDAARAAGLTPLLASRWADVQAMVGAARAQLDRHKDGGAMMFTNGQPEQTLVWIESLPGDPTADVWCRARLDWLRPGGIDDYKTCSTSANPETWTRSMFAAGADLQAAWYLRGLRALTGLDDAIFRFAVQETFPPYALAVIGLGPDALMLAEKKCLYALEVWRASRQSNDWVGYPRRTVLRRRCRRGKNRGGWRRKRDESRIPTYACRPVVPDHWAVLSRRGLFRRGPPIRLKNGLRSIRSRR